MATYSSPCDQVPTTSQTHHSPSPLRSLSSCISLVAVPLTADTLTSGPLPLLFSLSECSSPRNLHGPIASGKWQAPYAEGPEQGWDREWGGRGDADGVWSHIRNKMGRLAFSVFLLHRGKGSTCLAMVNTFLEPHQHNYKDFFPAIFSFSVISSLSSLSFSLLDHSQKHKKKIFSSPILKYKQVKNNKMKEKLSVEPMFPSAFTPFSWVPFTTT